MKAPGDVVCGPHEDRVGSGLLKPLGLVAVFRQLHPSPSPLHPVPQEGVVFIDGLSCSLASSLASGGCCRKW